MRWFVMSVAAVALSLLASSVLSAAEPVRLTEWEGKASTLNFPGANLEQFRLRAVTIWPSELPRITTRYRVRLDGPNGRAVTHQWSDNDAASGRWTTAFIPVDWVRDRLPETVQIRVTLVDAATGAAVSNTLAAGIDQFPRPSASSIVPDPGPFGWGEPLQRDSSKALAIPRRSSEGYRFVLLPGDPAVLASVSETSIEQFKRLKSGYDPAAGRSDEFQLDQPDQPAIGITPRAAVEYVTALSEREKGGIGYRLPTRAEWIAAARADAPTRFWWGDAPTFPEGANFAGDEPGLAGDATAKSTGAGFKPNNFGLSHTFGNVDEWAVDSGGRFVRLGGHFRSEIEKEIPEEKIDDAGRLGSDPYVGLRPFADFQPARIEAQANRLLAADPRLGRVRAAFDPARLTIVLTGNVEQPADRRAADEAIGPIWVVAAVENKIESPRFENGRLAEIGARDGEIVAVTILGKPFERAAYSVSWAEPLPATGSSWWVNILGPNGVLDSHRMFDDPTRGGRLLIQIDRSKAGKGGDIRFALSLGAPATGPSDPRIVSNSVPLGRP